MFMKKIFISLLLLLFYSVSPGQSELRGRVLDKETGLPLAGAYIHSVDRKFNAITDHSGWFPVSSVGSADTITITSVGYKKQKIYLSADNFTFYLEAEAASLAEVIISGNRESQLRTETPLTIHSISKTTINETKATRLDMLLNKVPGVFMVDLGNEQHSMSMRQPLGYTNLYLYLQDGVPIRTVGDFNHNALIEINQAAVGNIEVIKGPASSLYGSEAVGGAVNFITPSPSQEATGKVQVEAGSRGYRRADFFASNSYRKLGFYVSGYYADQDQDERRHNDFRKLALTVRADYSFDERNKLIFTGDYIDYKTDQVGGLDSARFYSRNYESRYRFTYRKVNARRSRLSYERLWGARDKTTVTLFHRNTAIGQNPFYSIGIVPGSTTKARGQINEDAFKSYGGIIQHRKNLGFMEGKWIMGISADFSPATYWARYIAIDIDKDQVFSSYTRTDSVLTNYLVDLFNSAVYTQIEISLVDRLRLVAAARYDRMDYNFDNLLPPGSYSGAKDASNHFSYFTPKLGLTYRFSGHKGVYANYSVGFAPPNITDLFTGVQVPELKPSNYNNYEIGGWIYFAGGKGNAELTVFQLDGRNEIVSTRLPDGTSRNQNAGKTSHSGIEANFRYEFARTLQFRAGGTLARHKYTEYTQQDNNYSGNYMGQAPLYIVNGEVTFKPVFAKGVRLSLEWQSLGSYYTDPQNTQKYKGFNLFNARAGYRYKAVDIWLNCLNIADVVYATTVEKSAWGTNYRPGQMRTFNTGIAYLINYKAQ